MKRVTAPAAPTGGPPGSAPTERRRPNPEWSGREGGIATGAIELNGLTKSFGEVLAVDDVRAAALPGQVTALLGPNGAGKTTALRMLLGLVAPDSGVATIGGKR